MTQAPTGTQDLLKVLLGSGGVLGAITLIGGFVGFLIRKQIATIEQDNQNLRRENARLEASLAKSEENEKKSADEVASLFTILEGLRESDLSADDAGRLKRVLGGLRRMKSMQEGLEIYKTAARWLEIHKTEWAKTAAKATIREHPRLVPKKLRKQFEADIINYLNWVYTSLYVYGHAKAPLKKFVESPAIQASFPYTSAINHIRNNGDRKELTVDQAMYLEKMLDELVRKLEK